MRSIINISSRIIKQGLKLKYTIMTEETKMILSFPREFKIKCLEDALLEDRFDIFLSLSKILLNAPLNEGGLESEIIEKIHNDNK